MPDSNKAYQEALDYLYSFVDYSLTRSFRFHPDQFELGRMHTLLHLLGDPHKTYRVIHVAGTKGKGSTAAMIASALRAEGYRVGFYTSPHLQEYTERIQVDGQEIPQAELAALVEELKPAIAQVQRLTTFEITTALAFLYFARKGVEIAVAEVGLGGRLDATNVVDPLVSVITSLSYDHMAVLGDTLAKIAFEKAGIIKPNRPVVMALQVDEAREVIEKVCAERGSPLTEVGKTYGFEESGHTLESQTFLLWPRSAGETQAVSFTLPLLGRHQVENAATAYAVLQQVNASGIKVSLAAIQKGFASVVWPCRFEILSQQPVLVVDSAHNRDSAKRLRQTFEQYFPGANLVLLFGASEDKDIAGIFDELLPVTQRVIATQSVHPRALQVEQIIELAKPYQVPVFPVVPVEEAVRTALEQAREKDVILAAGSLFVAAAVRAAWMGQNDR